MLKWVCPIFIFIVVYIKNKKPIPKARSACFVIGFLFFYYFYYFYRRSVLC